MKLKNKLKLNIVFIFAIYVFASLFYIFPAKAEDVSTTDIISFTNEERRKAGMNELVENELLDKAAGLKADDMLANKYFSHVSPSGIDPWHWFGQVGYDYRYAGENLAMDFRSATAVNDAWMKSPSHKENILSSKYNEIGVAIRKGIIENKETQIAVQLFGAKEGGETEAIAKVMQEFVSGIDIKEASVYPWKGSSGDEALVYARIEGKPVKVEALYGKESFELEPLRENVYMNLVSVKNMDFNKNSLMIKAAIDDEQAVFYQVPSEAVALAGNSQDDQEEEKEENAAVLYSDSDTRMSNIFMPNLILLAGFIFFIALIINIWILEKEDEKWILAHNI